MKDLKVGDLVLLTQTNYRAIRKVEKVLKTGYRIEKLSGSIFDKNGDLKGVGKWDQTASIVPITAEEADTLRKEFQENTERRTIIQEISKFNFSSIPTEELKVIFRIIKKKNNDEKH